MNLYITRLNGIGGITQTMQCMTAEIAHQLGFREMGIYRYNANAEKMGDRSVRFDGMIAGITAGDIVVCQLHTWNGLKFERALIEHIKAYHGRIVIFIHSVESLAIKSSRFMLRETVELYNQAEALIVPSQEMKRFLRDLGIREGMKFIVQEMWDYCTGISFRNAPAFRREIHCTEGIDTNITDNWDFDIPLKLYAPVAAKGRNVHCVGGLNQDELLLRLSEGGFGMVWYQDEYAYQYMRYINSFPLSRYLAAGIPVIVPVGISCQKLIEGNHIGLVVSSSDEAAETIERMTEPEYQEYVRHVSQFAPALRNGYYTKKCLTDSALALFRKDMGRAFIQASDVYELGDYQFLAVTLKKSYGGKLALSWNLKGTPDGFLIYDSLGRLIEEAVNSYQHYSLISGYNEGTQFLIKAYVNTQKGKLIVAESRMAGLCAETYEKPLVSVVIPAYNAEEHLIRCIDTVLAQCFSNLEAVIVDDGSTDSTADIIDWYAQNYPNVIVIHQENKGVQAARNTGIMQARGEYTGFVDSDDMIRPDMIGELYASAKTNNCDIAITSGYQISRGYDPIMQYPVEEDTAIMTEEFLQIYASGGYALPAVWNKLYRTSLVREHLFPLIVYEDEAWTPYILSYADRICYQDGLSYEYDRSVCGGSLVDKWARKTMEEIFSDHKRSISFYLEHGNPARLDLLKELAGSELGSFTRATGYKGYEEFRKQIQGI